jgi:hypothetical protein
VPGCVLPAPVGDLVAVVGGQHVLVTSSSLLFASPRDADAGVVSPHEAHHHAVLQLPLPAVPPTASRLRWQPATPSVAGKPLVVHRRFVAAAWSPPFVPSRWSPGLAAPYPCLLATLSSAGELALWAAGLSHTLEHSRRRAGRDDVAEGEDLDGGDGDEGAAEGGAGDADGDGEGDEGDTAVTARLMHGAMSRRHTSAFGWTNVLPRGFTAWLQARGHAGTLTWCPHMVSQAGCGGGAHDTALLLLGGDDGVLRYLSVDLLLDRTGPGGPAWRLRVQVAGEQRISDPNRAALPAAIAAVLPPPQITCLSFAPARRTQGAVDVEEGGASADGADLLAVGLRHGALLVLGGVLAAPLAFETPPLRPIAAVDALAGSLDHVAWLGSDGAAIAVASSAAVALVLMLGPAAAPAAAASVMTRHQWADVHKRLWEVEVGWVVDGARAGSVCGVVRILNADPVGVHGVASARGALAPLSTVAPVLDGGDPGGGQPEWMVIAGGSGVATAWRVAWLCEAMLDHAALPPIDAVRPCHLVQLLQAPPGLSHARHVTHGQPPAAITGLATSPAGTHMLVTMVAEPWLRTVPKAVVPKLHTALVAVPLALPLTPKLMSAVQGQGFVYAAPGEAAQPLSAGDLAATLAVWRHMHAHLMATVLPQVAAGCVPPDSGDGAPYSGAAVLQGDAWFAEHTDRLCVARHASLAAGWIHLCAAVGEVSAALERHWVRCTAANAVAELQARMDRAPAPTAGEVTGTPVVFPLPPFDVTGDVSPADVDPSLTINAACAGRGGGGGGGGGAGGVRSSVGAGVGRGSGWSARGAVGADGSGAGDHGAVDAGGGVVGGGGSSGGGVSAAVGASEGGGGGSGRDSADFSGAVVADGGGGVGGGEGGGGAERGGGRTRAATGGRTGAGVRGAVGAGGGPGGAGGVRGAVGAGGSAPVGADGGPRAGGDGGARVALPAPRVLRHALTAAVTPWFAPFALRHAAGWDGGSSLRSDASTPVFAHLQAAFPDAVARCCHSAHAALAARDPVHPSLARAAALCVEALRWALEDATVVEGMQLLSTRPDAPQPWVRLAGDFVITQELLSRHPAALKQNKRSFPSDGAVPVVPMVTLLGFTYPLITAGHLPHRWAWFAAVFGPLLAKLAWIAWADGVLRSFLARLRLSPATAAGAECRVSSSGSPAESPIPRRVRIARACAACPSAGPAHLDAGKDAGGDDDDADASSGGSHASHSADRDSDGVSRDGGSVQTSSGSESTSGSDRGGGGGGRHARGRGRARGRGGGGRSRGASTPRKSTNRRWGMARRLDAPPQWPSDDETASVGSDDAWQPLTAPHPRPPVPVITVTTSTSRATTDARVCRQVLAIATAVASLTSGAHDAEPAAADALLDALAAAVAADGAESAAAVLTLLAPASAAATAMAQCPVCRHAAAPVDLPMPQVPTSTHTLPAHMAAVASYRDPVTWTCQLVGTNRPPSHALAAALDAISAPVLPITTACAAGHVFLTDAVSQEPISQPGHHTAPAGGGLFHSGRHCTVATGPAGGPAPLQPPTHGARSRPRRRPRSQKGAGGGDRTTGDGLAGLLAGIAARAALAQRAQDGVGGGGGGWGWGLGVHHAAALAPAAAFPGGGAGMGEGEGEDEVML